MSLRVDSPLLAAADLRLADDLFTAVGQLRRHGRRLGGGPVSAGALSGAQVELVRLVRRRPGLSVAEAAAELALAPNTVSTLVGQLAEVDVLTRVDVQGEVLDGEVHVYGHDLRHEAMAVR